MDVLFQDINKNLQIDYASNTRGGQMALVHYHSAYEIYILEKGERTYIIDGDYIELTDRDVAFIKPYQLHNTDGGAYSRHLLYFKQDYLDRFFTQSAKEQLLVLFDQKKRTLTEQAHKKLKTLLLALSSDPENFLTFCQIMDLFFSADAQTDNKTGHKKNKLIYDLIKYVTEHYLEIDSLDMLADTFYITKPHLCRLFKKETGVSVITYINTQKIHRACEKLKFTKDNVDTIASTCGFNSSMYFCALFKRTMGCTPSEYRRQTQL